MKWVSGITSVSSCLMNAFRDEIKAVHTYFYAKVEDMLYSTPSFFFLSLKKTIQSLSILLKKVETIFRSLSDFTLFCSFLLVTRVASSPIWTYMWPSRRGFSFSQSLGLLTPNTMGVGASNRSHSETMQTIECQQWKGLSKTQVKRQIVQLRTCWLSQTKMTCSSKRMAERMSQKVFLSKSLRMGQSQNPRQASTRLVPSVEIFRRSIPKVNSQSSLGAIRVLFISVIIGVQTLESWSMTKPLSTLNMLSNLFWQMPNLSILRALKIVIRKDSKNSKKGQQVKMLMTFLLLKTSRFLISLDSFLLFLGAQLAERLLATPSQWPLGDQWSDFSFSLSTASGSTMVKSFILMEMQYNLRLGLISLRSSVSSPEMLSNFSQELSSQMKLVCFLTFCRRIWLTSLSSFQFFILLQNKPLGNKYLATWSQYILELRSNIENTRWGYTSFSFSIGSSDSPRYVHPNIHRSDIRGNVGFTDFSDRSSDFSDLDYSQTTLITGNPKFGSPTVSNYYQLFYSTLTPTQPSWIDCWICCYGVERQLLIADLLSYLSLSISVELTVRVLVYPIRI